MNEHDESADGGTELTTKEQEAIVKQAFDLERRIKQRTEAGRQAWWDLAEVLHEFHEVRGWEPLGYDTLEEFLGQPDIGLSRRSFFRAVQVWRDLAVVKQLPPSDLKDVEPSKAIEVRPAIMSGSVKAEDALDDAKELSVRDVIEKYRPSRQAAHGQSPDDSTTLDASSESTMVRCPTCRSYVAEDQLPEEARG